MSGEIVRVEAAALGGGRLRYFDFVMAAFVTVMVV